MITSTQNPKIKRVRLLQSGSKSRKKEGAFVLEGIRLLEEALQAGIKAELLLFTPELDPRGLKLVRKFETRGVLCESVDSAVFSAACDTQTPQGVLGVFPIIKLALPDRVDFLIIADELRDPGNLGTLMRTAAAAGADGLIITPGTADPYSPKVVRSAMGAHFHLPLISATWPEIKVLTEGLEIFLADMKEGRSLWESDLTSPLAIILGGEAHGPGKKARQLASQTIHIPIEESTESLNAASAGAVLLFEVYRQRSNPSQ
jgi:TrmH family RNA methyltransferase